jgi:hypothetical protein
VRKGFVDLIFSIYRTLPREACDALEVMGVLRPGIDRFSIERIATELLKTFATTLASAENKCQLRPTSARPPPHLRPTSAPPPPDLCPTSAPPLPDLRPAGGRTR